MTTDAVGGVWSYALALTRALTTHHDAEVTLAVTGPAPSDDQAEAALAAGAGAVHHAPFKLEWMQGADSDVDAANAWLRHLADVLSPDVVHVNGFAQAAAGFDAPVVCVAHSSVTTWWHAVHDEPPPREYDAYNARVREGLLAADVLVAPTRAFAESLVTHHDVEKDVRVIPNAVADAPAPASGKAHFVLAVGRLWDEAKNLRTLDAASARVPWPVRVAGAALDPQTGSRAEAEHARLMGLVDDATLADAFARASVFAHPSLYEPFGLAPLEAAHAGCALVLADVPTLREVWRDAAVFVPPRDADAWATALTDLARDDARRRGLAERALERARDLDLASLGDAYARVYAELSGPRPLTRRKEETPTCAS